MTIRMIRAVRGAAAILALAAAPALAAGDHAGGHHDAAAEDHHAHGGGHHAAAIGAPGDPEEVDRKIEVSLDEMTFSRDRIHVEKGETIRFVLANEGELVHEFNIGTAAMHAAHREEMMAMVESGMLEADRINREAGGPHLHDDPNSVLLAPDETAELVWTFGAEADLEFSCNVPGHREAGMVGAFDIGPGRHEHGHAHGQGGS